jgi:CheY-like chemotaxis protein/HAMP domain-containing protein
MTFALRRIRSKLMFWFLLFSLAPFALAIVLSYQGHTREALQEGRDRIDSILGLKAREVNNWLSQRMSDVLTISTDFEIRDLDELHNQNLSRTTEAQQQRIRVAQELLQRYMIHYPDYRDLYLVSAGTGDVITSASGETILSDGLNRGLLHTVTDTRTPRISEMYYNNRLALQAIDFVAPVLCRQHNGRHVTALLVAQVNLENSLFDLLADATGLGETGESLLLRGDSGELLSAPRHGEQTHPAVSENLADLPMHGSGLVQHDYRGHRVMTSWRRIPQTGWVLLGKQDIDEILASPRSDLLRQLVLILVAGGLLLVLVTLISQSLSKPITEMADAADEFRKGNYDLRLDWPGGEELGLLASALNQMADSVQTRIRTQELTYALAEPLLAETNRIAFARSLLETMLDKGGFAFGAVYARNAEGNQLELTVSEGLTDDAPRTFGLAPPEGQIARAIRSGRIAWLSDFQEQSFVFRSVAGDLLPREMVVVPLCVGQAASRVQGAMILGAMTEVLPAVREALRLAQPAIHAILGNVLSLEETQRLNEEINSQNEELTVANEELQSQSEELRQQAEELRGLADELERQRRQVEQADRLKSEFLSNMSHELRTPLNSVMALSQLMIRRGTGKDIAQEAEYLGIIERNGRQLLHLINDILDLSKIEAGRMEVHPTGIDAAELVRQLAQSVEPMVRKKSLAFHLQLPEDLPMVTDESKLRQILTNLVSNAVKFTEEGSVTVTARTRADEAVFEVRDTGIGISEQDMDYLFDEFRQLDGSTTRRYEGTGLGLAITRRLTEILGGRIEVQSTVGEGSVFIVTVPLRLTGTSTPSLSEPHVFPHAAPSVAPDAPERTLLVIDDDSHIRSLLREHFQPRGFEVLVAEDAKQGLHLARTKQPDVITVDVLMPEMDGWEVLRALQTDAATRRIPVVMVTMCDDRKTAVALGATGFVPKPIDRCLLLEQIRTLGQTRPIQRVLLVEDDAAVRSYVGNALVDQPYVLDEAASTAEARGRIEQFQPDLLILDLTLPDGDGLEILKSLRCEQNTAELPVIVLTARSLDEAQRQELHASGASVVVKGEMDKARLAWDVEQAVRDAIEKRAAAPADPQRPLVLVVEDNEVATLQIRSSLPPEEFEFAAVRDGREALEFLRTRLPDAVVLDLMMPRVDGFGVLRDLTNIPGAQHVPVLVLTAKELTASEHEILSRANVRQLIRKGNVQREQLLSAIRGIIAPTAAHAPDHPSEQTAPAPKPKSDAAAPQPESSAAPRPDREQPCLLIVEDNPDNLTTIHAILEEFPATLVVARDGHQAVEQARTHVPDLILMDIQLPGLGGEDAAARIREIPHLGGVPIIAMTAKAMKGDRETILAGACDDYLSKPLHPDQTLHCIRRWLGEPKGNTPPDTTND